MKATARALLALASACLAVFAMAQSAQVYDLDIPRQPIAGALNDLSRQTGLQISLFRGLPSDVTMVGPLTGRYSIEAALARLLERSRLSYKWVNERTIAITAQPRTATGTSRARSSDARVADIAEEIQQALSRELDDDSERLMRERERRMEEVIVTAQKREQPLQDVPIAVSVLRGEALDVSSFMSVNDALRSVPGVVMYENPQAGMSKIAIRGVTSNASLFNGSSVIGYYFDEIPFAFVRYPVTPDASSYDLERVEVLRGPQGTLYGASSLNGVVRILTHDADLQRTDFKARSTVSSTHDGGQNYRVDAALNLPVIPGKLAVRGVAGYADHGGWIDLPAAGVRDVNEGKDENGRLKVNAAVTDRLGVELLSWFSRSERGAPARSTSARTSPVRIPETISNGFDAYGMTLTYELPAASILSATSHIDFEASSLLDTPQQQEILLTVLEAKMTSQEVRATSKSEGPWRWSLGGIYRDAEDRRFQDSMFEVFFRGVGDNRFSSESFAIFGELSRTFHGGRMEVTAGLRYFEDEATSNELAAETPTTEPEPSIPYGKKRAKFHALTPRLVLTYHRNERSLLYASYGEGFRSGFAQIGDVLRIADATPAVDPDRLSNYELGAKGSTAGGRLNYDLTVYYIEWRDAVQVLLNSFQGGVFYAAVNAGTIDGFGVDATGSIALGDAWELGAKVSWNDLQFAEDVYSDTGLLYPKGARPSESSELTAGGELSYSTRLGRDYFLRLSGSVEYVSKLVAPAMPDVALIQGDDLVLARAGLTLGGPGGWSIMLFVDNLADENGKIRPVLATVPELLDQSDRLRPRTYGLQLDYRFR